MKTELPTLMHLLSRPSPRKRKIATLEPILRDIYFDLYRTNSISALIASEPHPLEEFIDSAPNFPEAIAEALGVCVPSGFDTLQYLYANIVEYRYLFDPPSPEDTQLLLSGVAGLNLNELIRRYSDSALFYLLKGYIPYRSREQLVERVSQLLSQGSFFYPLERRSSNSQTYLGEDVDDPTIPMIAYGKPNDYRCYSVDEFLLNFKPKERLFYLPGTHQTLSREQLVLLREIAIVYEMKQLASRIGDELSQLSKSLPSLNDKNERAKVILYLVAVFEAGMYMRRWDGVGAYPLLEEDTLKKLDPMPLTSIALVKVNELYSSLGNEGKRFVDNLEVVRYSRGVLENHSDRLVKILDSLFRGSYCIRQASAYLCSTSYYVLREGLGFVIPNFDPKRLNCIV